MSAFVPLSTRLRECAAEWHECGPDLMGTDTASLHARYSVFAALHEMGWSYKRIGVRFGMNHSTVINAVKRSAEIADASDFYAAGLSRLRSICRLYVAGQRPLVGDIGLIAAMCADMGKGGEG